MSTNVIIELKLINSRRIGLVLLSCRLQFKMNKLIAQNSYIKRKTKMSNFIRLG